MLLINNILEKMKNNFPKYMDIRRKLKTSSGGLSIYSIAEEIEEINEEIDKYKSSFFIEDYMDAYDKTIAFIYKCSIGDYDFDLVSVKNPNLRLVNNQEEFHKKDDVALFEDGILYFKKDYGDIQYSIENYISTATLEKMHVWNIYDEFAIFVGLKRFQNETNEELLNRILYKSNVVTNSTEDGIKNALITNLINIAPNLTKEDILIERPTAENLVKYYDEKNSLLDHLLEINRDVYKTKRWDIDTWNFEFKAIDYIPHVWDVVLKEYANGIGDNDDLKVSIIDSSVAANAEVSFYKRKEEVVNSYVRNNNIKETFNLKLRKYEDDLIAEKVPYKIEASEAIKINPSEIEFNLYEDYAGTKELLLQDITDSYLYGIQTIDNSELDPLFNYKARFYSENEFSKFEISKLEQIDAEGNATNLVKQVSNFSFTDEYRSGVKLGSSTFIEDKYMFSEIDNISKETSGFVISNIQTHGSLKLNVNAFSGNNVYYDYSAESVPFLYSNIKRTNAYILNEYIVADTVPEDSFVEIDTTLNYMSLKIDGPYKIEYSINNNNLVVISDYNNKTYNFEIDQKDVPQHLKMKISLLSEETRIYDINYNHFELTLSTSTGSFSQNKYGSQLPMAKNNDLTIRMRTYTGFSPKLKFIHIGRKPNDGYIYGDIEIDTDNGSKIDFKFTGCKMILDKYSKDGEFIESIDNYRPYIQYSPLGADALLDIYLDKYTKIELISSEKATPATTNYGNGYIQHSIKIPSGEFVDSIKVTGRSQELLGKKTLEDVIYKKGYPLENNFYITKNSQDIISVNEYDEMSFVRIQREDVLNRANVTNIQVINTSDVEMNIKFIEIDEVSAEKVTTVTSNLEGYFDYVTLEPLESNVYSAMNVTNSIFPEIWGINIVNTFSKGYDDNKLMFYKVQSFNDKYDVFFENMRKECLDKHPLVIKRMGDDINYNFETLELSIDFTLGTKISLPRQYSIQNNEKIDLSQYIIRNNDLNIEYSDKDIDPANSKEYEKIQTLYTNGTGFNKLAYSNIKSITSISYLDDENTLMMLREGIDYKLLNKEGILIWSNPELKNNMFEVKVFYNIKKAKYIIIPYEDIYKKINYSINAYELISRSTLEAITAPYSVNLNLFDSYKDSDLVSVNFSEPGFVSKVEDDILNISRSVEKNTVAVRSGFYYMDGNEYYLFAKDNYENVEKIDNVYLKDVLKENKSFFLRQQTTNYIKNSAMVTNNISNIYNLNTSSKKIKGISNLKGITACDNYNYWSSFNCSLSITKGLNSQGIKITSIDKHGYVYLPLDQYMSIGEDLMLSFYLDGTGKAYLGKERVLYSTSSLFNKQSVIDVISEIKSSEIDKRIKECVISKENNDDKFYLIVRGNAIIDDIILTENSSYDISYHMKNLDILNLDIEENIYSNYNVRLFLQQQEGSVFDGTEIKDEKIINSSYIDWGFTKHHSIKTYEDFKKCILENIIIDQFNDKASVRTSDKEGSVFTNAIYIGNVKIIKNLLLKINNVMFDEMAKFKITIYTSDNPYTNFKEVSRHLDNICSVDGEKLASYIKIKVDMAKDKVIDNLEMFIEYLSDSVNAPADMTVISGTYISKILDSQYNDNFLLKDFKFEENNKTLDNYIFYVRGSKENNENNVWTDWKEIELRSDGSLKSRISFNGYRYFQFKTVLKGKDTSIKIKHIDLEVI